VSGPRGRGEKRTGRLGLNLGGDRGNGLERIKTEMSWVRGGEKFGANKKQMLKKDEVEERNAERDKSE